jgi:Mg2+/Co2+ transporter CorC
MDESAERNNEINKRNIREKLSKIEAADIAISRSEVALVNIDSTFDEMLAAVIEDGHSRFPVFSEKIDNIVGFLYVKDLLPLFRNCEDFDKFSMESVLRKPLFISENKKVSDLFNEFIATHIHMAIVADEYGTFTA